MLQIVVVVAFLVASAVYAAPGVIAIMRGHRRWLPILVLDLALGWTVVGWLLALALSLGIAPRRPAWTRRAPTPRPGPVKDKRMEPVAMASPIDPPVVREDVYAAWLDEGTAIPETRRD